MQQSSHGFLDKLKAKLDRGGGRKSGSTVPPGSLSIATGAIVSVNVYDMLWLNVYTNSLGIGVYHTGVVIYGTEYCYGGHPFDYSGIFAMAPQDSETLGPNYSYRTTINLGWTDFTESDISLILEDMGPQYRGDQYHLLHRNCNHFSDAFVQILCGSSLPKWINRLATVGAKLPFVERSIPKMWLTPRPLEDIDSPQSHQFDANLDNQLCSCPALTRTEPSSACSSPHAQGSNPFTRLQSALKQRRESERPSSSTSLRGLLRHSRRVSTTGSLASIADSLNVDFNVPSACKMKLSRATSSLYHSSHSRLREGDSRERTCSGKTNAACSCDLTDLNSLEISDSMAKDKHFTKISPAKDSHSASKRYNSFLNRLGLPIPTRLSSERPSFYAPSELSTDSVKTLASIGSEHASFNETACAFSAPLSENVITVEHNSKQHLHPIADDAPITFVMEQQTSTHTTPSNTDCKLSRKLYRGSPNCGHTLTSGLLTRLQNLCGTTDLHDCIHRSPTFDSDTNSVTNSAF